MQTTARARLLASIFLIMSLCGCLSRTRVVDRRQVNTSNLLKATLPELVDRIGAEARKISSLSANVEISVSTGGAKKGKVTDYQSIKGYILEKDPDMLHVIGLLPVVRSRAFDMVSDGSTFKLSIPPLNRFIVGPAGEPAQPSANTLENLRPHVFFDSLLLHEIRQDEIPVLEQGEQVVQDSAHKNRSWQVPNYTVDVIRKDGGAWRLERRISFDRTQLNPYRQRIYDETGQVATEALYSDFLDYDGVKFPSHIVINRPREEYTINITIEKLEINKALTADQFTLTQPPGAQLRTLK